MIKWHRAIAMFSASTWVLACLSGCGQDQGSQGNVSFEQYVMAFQPRPLEGRRVPVLQPLPERIYESAISLSEKFPSRFEEMVCLYLAKYHIYYLRHFHQGYSFVHPDELGQVNPDRVQRDKYFMLNAFLRFSGYGIGKEDGAPSTMVVYYCRAKPGKSDLIRELLEEVADAEN